VLHGQPPPPLATRVLSLVLVERQRHVDSSKTRFRGAGTVAVAVGVRGRKTGPSPMGCILLMNWNRSRLGAMASNGWKGSQGPGAQGAGTWN
jgi:hypothetical protein